MYKHRKVKIGYNSSMNPESISQDKTSEKPKGLEMYFSPEVVQKFAELEQNEKNFKVANIVDTVLMQETTGIGHPIFSAELGGGAHPDRYDAFFKKLIQEGGHMDWVDISPYMLELAEKYIATEEFKERRKVITCIKSTLSNTFATFLEKSLM